MENGSKKIIDASLDIVDSLHDVITEVEQGMDQRLGPVRKNLIERFPALFLLTVTMGLALVIYSMELIFARWDWVQNYPWIALVIGISILLATGTLYKKLS
jgi:uncharacterized membrane protein YcjF (UPF0283 family)